MKSMNVMTPTLIQVSERAASSGLAGGPIFSDKVAEPARTTPAAS